MDLKSELFSRVKLKVAALECKRLGLALWVKEMTGAERDRFEEISREKVGSTYRANLTNFRAKLACFCLCDETGQRLYSEADIEKLGQLPGQALDEIAQAAVQVNLMSSQDIEELANFSVAPQVPTGASK